MTSLWKIITATLAVLSLASAAQAQLPGLDAGLGGVHQDSDEAGFNMETMDQEFSGDVVLIGGGTLLAADEVKLNNKMQRVYAQGHIVVMTRDQVFTGSSLEYDIPTGDFQIFDAIMVTGDKSEVETIASRVLGFTPREAEFETARKKRLSEISARQMSVRRQARDLLREQGSLSEALIDDYALLLEQEELVKSQENPALGRLDPKTRERFKNRRKYWEATQKNRPQVQKLRDYYFRIDAEYIERTNDNDFYAAEAFWTPCKCDEDERPAWGFQTDEATAQVGGYADLYHPVLMIKGIPVLYLPYLKIPIKSTRQSGFLLPMMGFERRSGNIISQPIYFALSDSSDATLTTDVFENRGTRLGIEYRFQQSEYSGWEIALEGMRDRLWMRDRGLRSDLNSMYQRGLTETEKKLGSGAFSGSVDAFTSPNPAISHRERTADALEDPDFWDTVDNKRKDRSVTPEGIEDLRREVDEQLAVPANSWRSAYKWQGVTFFAPRLSLVSKGEVQSDHRYGDELDILENFEESYSGNQKANAYSAARARLHLDGQDFYAGLGMRYGDNQLTDSQYEGQQIPLHFRVRTKYYSLFPQGFPIPIYLGARLDNIRISEFKQETDADEFTEEPVSLGDGSWRRLLLDTVSPITTDQIVQISHFSELEGRYIEHAGLSEPRSEIRSWRTGLSFVLPIDGLATIPEGWQSEDDLEKGPRTIHHFMDWELQLSLRPSVVKRGPYTNPAFEDQQRYAYFSSDSPVTHEKDIDDAVENEDRMRPHRIVSLSTNQWWSTYRHGWRKAQAAPSESTDVPVEETTRDRARRELLYSLDRPVEGVADMFSQEGESLLVDLYEKTKVDVLTPVTFEADISYDFLAAEKRLEQRESNRQQQPLVLAALARVEAKERELSVLDQELDQITDEETQKARRDIVAKELKALQADYRAERAKILSLDEPVTGPRAKVGIRYAGWSLGTEARYNVYKRANERANFTLSPPTVFDSRLTLGYLLEKTLYEDRTFVLTKTQSVRLTTSLLRDWTVGVDLRKRIPDDKNKATNHSKIFAGRYDAVYTSPSDCWGLKFSRIKDYSVDEAEATYLLQLTILFLGEPRGLPNMSPALFGNPDAED